MSRKDAELEQLYRQDWLGLRKTGIGGSDVAAILGLSPWKSALDVYLDKVLPDVEDRETDAMIRGRYLESGIAEWYCHDTQTELAPYPDDLCQRTVSWEPWMVQREGWMLGSPDALILAPETREPQVYGLEVKTAKRADDWGPSGTDQVPAYYATQAIWYMAVCDIEEWDFAVFFMFTDQFRRYTLRRDKLLEERIVAKCQAFWRDVLAEMPPPPGPNDQKAIQRMHPEAHDREVHQATHEEAVALRMLATHRDVMAGVKERHDQAKAELMAMIGDRYGIESEDGRATFGNVAESVGLDTSALKREDPGLHASLLDKYPKIRPAFRRFALTTRRPTDG